jgi:hypothetical protein
MLVRASMIIIVASRFTPERENFPARQPPFLAEGSLDVKRKETFKPSNW